MNLSPISILSSSEELSSCSASTEIQIHNMNFEKFKANLLESKTPSGIDKVVDWKMTVSPLLDDEARMNTDCTFFRYDYKVNDPNSLAEDEEIISVFNRSVPLCDNSPQSRKKIKLDCVEHISIGSHSNSNCSMRLKNLNETFIRNGDVHFNPPSVESEKKELYSYLKLMNHVDKKKVRSSLSIRSTRSNILKRKEMADKIHSEDCNNGSSNSVQSTISQLDLSSNESKIFNFVMPPSDVLNEFNDFYHWIAPLVKKREKFNKKHKLNGKVSIDNVENGQIDSNIQLRNKKYLRSNTEKTENYELNKFRKKYRDKSISFEEKCGEISTENYIEMDNNSEKSLVNKTNGVNTDISNNGMKKMLPIVEMNVNTAIHEENNEINPENNVHIRIDYNTLNKDKEQEQKSFSDIKIKQIFLHHGFNRNDINKSHNFYSKIREFLNHLSTPPVVEVEDQLIIHNVGEEELNQLIASTKNTEDYDSDSTSNTSINSDVSSSSSSISHKEIQPVSRRRISSPKCDIIDPNQIAPRTNEVQPFNHIAEVQPLHNLLKKQLKKPPKMVNNMHEWDSDSSTNDKQNKPETNKNNSHFISFDNDNGPVQSAIYVDFQLLLIQEFAVSLWNQTALGNVLGAQNLWMFNGCTKKLILNKECIRKDSLEMVASMESCIVYVELWTKEHKSDIRQGPVADVFATVYFWIQKHNKMEKKVLQLENINGFADDVQYVVLKPSLNIVVSWHSIVEDNKITQIHVYTLATDLQKVVNVRAMAKVEHYVSSLHNIEDCEELLMGCGENKITLWNIEHGYIVATIELSEIKLSLCTLWVKCDRGILLTLQQCVDRELRLIAINGRNLSWKRLKSYKPTEGFDRIQNVYIENGILISFYEEGILCWRAQTGEQILEEIHTETDVKYISSGRHLIILTKKNVFLQHSLTHLLTVDD